VLAVLLFAIAVSIDGFAAGVAEGLRGIKVPLGSLLVMNVVSAVVVFLSVGSGRAVAGFLTPIAGRLIGGGILMTLGAWMLLRGQTSTAPAGEARRASGTAHENVAAKDPELPDLSIARQATVGRDRRGKAPGKVAGRQMDVATCRVVSESEAGNGIASGACRKPVSEEKGTGEGNDDAEAMGDGGRIETGGTAVRAAESRETPGAFLWRARLVRSLAMVPGLLDEPARADLDSSGTLTPGEAFLLGLALAIDALGVGFGAGMAGLSSTLTPLIAGATQFVFVSAGITIGRRIKMSALAPGLEKVPGGILILLGLMRLR